MLVPPGSKLVFEQVLYVTTAGTAGIVSAVSDPRFDDWLGGGNDAKWVAVIDSVSDFEAQLQLLSEQTPDPEFWAPTWGTSWTSLLGYGATTLTLVDSESIRGFPAMAFRHVKASMQSATVPCSARVRIWASLRGPVRRFNRLVFSDRMQEGEPAYLSPEALGDCIGEVDELFATIRADEVSSGTVTLTAFIEESPNGRTWQPVTALEQVIVSAGVYGLTISSSTPASKLLRCRLELFGTGAAARVRVWITGRDVFREGKKG